MRIWYPTELLPLGLERYRIVVRWTGSIFGLLHALVGEVTSRYHGDTLSCFSSLSLCFDNFINHSLRPAESFGW